MKKPAKIHDRHHQISRLQINSIANERIAEPSLKNFEAQQSKINATKNTQIVPECLLSVAGVAHRRA
jgi:hypothetical protein